MRRVRSLRPISAFVGGALLTLSLVACGGGGGSTATEPTGGESTPSEAAVASESATQEPGGGGSAAGLAALTPSATVEAVLGELPTPECETSVAFGGDSCVWMAADGSWVKVEYGESQETPTVEEFTTRMNDTLGLTDPAPGLGEAAFTNATSRGARIAVYLGDSNVLWVVIAKSGDGPTQVDQVTSMAEVIIAGL